MPEKTDMAPPCEKPPRTIREGLMPLSTCSLIRVLKYSRERRIPGSSWVRMDSSKSSCGQYSQYQPPEYNDIANELTSRPSLLRSYHPGMLIPKFYPDYPLTQRAPHLTSKASPQTYHCDGNHGRIRKNESDFIEHATTAPVLGEGHPA